MKKPKYRPIMFEKFRLVIGIIAFLMIIPQILTVSKMLSYNIYYDRELAQTKVEPEALDNLLVGQRIECMIDADDFINMVTIYDHVNSQEKSYAAVRTPQENVLILSIEENKAPVVRSDALFVYDSDYAEYFILSGTVKMSDTNLNLSIDELFDAEKVKEFKISQDKILMKYVDCYNPDSKYEDKYVIVDIISIPVLIAISLFLVIPTINNLRYLSAVKKGKVIPHKATRRRDVLNFYGGDYSDPTREPENEAGDSQTAAGTAESVFETYKGYEDDSEGGSDGDVQ